MCCPHHDNARRVPFVCTRVRSTTCASTWTGSRASAPTRSATTRSSPNCVASSSTSPSSTRSSEAGSAFPQSFPRLDILVHQSYRSCRNHSGTMPSNSAFSLRKEGNQNTQGNVFLVRPCEVKVARARHHSRRCGAHPCGRNGTMAPAIFVSQLQSMRTSHAICPQCQVGQLLH